MAEDDDPTKKHSIGSDITVEPKPTSHGGRRFAAGDLILGRYKVESELGQGGMGVVYKCLDKVGGVKVAVKGLPPDVAHNEGEMEEIRANFQLVCDLRHENIAGVRTLEKDASGDYYLVMDLAHGEDLGSWMRKNKDADLKARLSIIRQIASALDYAHRRKVMHRDIKPGNIMVSPSGRVLLLDFGLAAQISTSLSRTSRMVVSQSGTPAYKSPEQWRGNPQGAAADQYALAVVAYRLLSGRLPFDGDNVLILCRAVLEERPPAIKYLPSHINKALAKALSKDPHDRFPNCTAFADALEGKNAAGGFWRTALVVLLAVGAIFAACDMWLHFVKEAPPPVDNEYVQMTNALTVAVYRRNHAYEAVGPYMESPRGFVAKLDSIKKIWNGRTDADGKMSKHRVKDVLAVVSNEVAVLEDAVAWMSQNKGKRDVAVKKEGELGNFYTKVKEMNPGLFRPTELEDFDKRIKDASISINDGAFDKAVETIDEARQILDDILKAAKTKADEACSVALKERDKAKAAGVEIHNDDYTAACRRMEEAEDLYKRENYEQAELKFVQAAKQYSAICPQGKYGGNKITGKNNVTSDGDKSTTSVGQKPTSDGRSSARNKETSIGNGKPTPSVKAATDGDQTAAGRGQSTVGGPAPQPTIEQKKADQARLEAVEAQKKAINAGVKDQDGDYRAACSRMEEAEDFYKKGDYKQAETKFYMAVEQFSKSYRQVPTKGATATNDTAAAADQTLHVIPPPQPPIKQKPSIQPPIKQEPSIQQPVKQKPSIQQPTMQKTAIQPPAMQQPTIEHKKADQARLEAVEAQKKAISAGVKDQNDDYQAACYRIEEAEALYKKGKFKQASFKFYQAVNQFSATYESKE